MADRLPSLVLFDVGGVLLHLRPWNEAFPSTAELPPGKTLLEAVWQLKQSDTFWRFERGQATAEEFYAAVRQVFSKDLSDEAIRESYLRRLGPPMEGMVELVADLKAQKVRVCGLSDTSPIHLESLATYPAVQALERLVTSCDTGTLKPSPEAFQKALALLSADAETTLFVDDQPQNVEGARKVGLKAVAFQGATRLREDLGLLS